jgi:mono/diheme cytochrome c family protein
MKRSMGWILGVAVIAVSVGCAPQATTDGPPAAAAPAAPADATAAVSVYTGVYTTAQATRGQQVQQRECANCHSPGDWSQGRLLGGWGGQTVYQLVDNIRLTMPMDGPGRLSLQQYTDIVAWMLQLNEIPAGDEELPADEEGLRQITIEYRR